MKINSQLVVAALSLSIWLTGVSPVLAGGGKQDGDLSKKWNDDKKCDKDTGARCEDMAKQCEECAAKAKKEAAVKEEMSSKTSGEESQIYRQISKNFTQGAEEQGKMAVCIRNKDIAGYKNSQEACEKLMKENGKLWEQLKKIKGSGETHQKTGDTAKSNDKQNVSKSKDGSAGIESDADMKRWLNDDGSSKK